MEKANSEPFCILVPGTKPCWSWEDCSRIKQLRPCPHCLQPTQRERLVGAEWLFGKKKMEVNCGCFLFASKRPLYLSPLFLLPLWMETEVPATDRESGRWGSIAARLGRVGVTTAPAPALSTGPPAPVLHVMTSSASLTVSHWPVHSLFTVFTRIQGRL